MASEQDPAHRLAIDPLPQYWAIVVFSVADYACPSLADDHAVLQTAFHGDRCHPADRRLGHVPKLDFNATQ